jgi:hypothetical protein
MRKTRWLAAFFLPLLLVSFLQSQSLADLAKKEKERRAALKGKTATVITTADVAKVKKRPAVESTSQEQAGEAAAGQAGEGEAKAQEGAVPPETVQGAEAAAAGSGEAKPAPEKPAEPTAAEAQAAALKSVQTRTAELSKAAEDKQQLVDLLTLKMNALYQEFYSLDNLKSRELIQAQISDTYDKLLKAEMESKQATKDLGDFLAQAKKDSTPQIWIH